MQLQESRLNIPDVFFQSWICVDDEDTPCTVECRFIWSDDMMSIVPVLGKIKAKGIVYWDDKISRADRDRLEQEAYDLRA